MPTHVVTFVAPRTVEVRAEAMPVPGAGEVRVQTRRSAISPGTEGLVYRGEAPRDLAADATLDALAGGLAYPLAYGYAAVGVVEAVGAEVDADAWTGRRVFAFHPHATHFTARPETLLPLPDDVSDDEAVFLPNLETAVTLVMDGRPMLGERVAVFGQGVVGLLTTTLLARHPLGALVAVEPDAHRRARARARGATHALDPADTDALRATLAFPDALPDALPDASGPSAQEGGGYAGADLAYELSGQPAVLDDALGVLGYGGRLVVGSWYGTKTAPVALGGRFHRARQQIVSSQVSTVAPALSGRWTKARRMQAVLAQLPAARPADLITHRVPLADAPRAYALLDGATREADEEKKPVQIVFTYDDV